MNVGLEDPRYTPIFRTVQEMDVPIVVHATSGDQVSTAAGTDRYDKFFFTHMVSHPFDRTRHYHRPDALTASAERGWPLP
jgi:predicted TIM-barrel fold metal-dependent hydrolase